MKQNAVVAGVGMTHFGRHLKTGLKAIGAEAVQLAIKDAGLRPDDIQAAA
jgi:acetyl-CoA acetyltransferase